MDEALIVQRLACKAVISHKGKILLLREARTYKDGTNIGRYHMPGGRIDAGEPFLDGLRREVLEETGLRIKVGPPFFIGEWFPMIRGQRNQIVAMFFACIAITTKVRLSEEHDGFVWITPASYENYDVMDPEGQVIDTWIKK